MTTRTLLRELWEGGVFVTTVACTWHVFTTHVAEVYMCIGPSMLPTFNQSGDVFLMEHLSTKFKAVKRGDVVIAKSPSNPRLTVCKRVLGLSGDKVTVMPVTSRERMRTVVVPKGHVWLQGDNLYNSTDSRHYGPVPYALMKGKVFYKVWPLREAGLVQNKIP